MYCHANTLQTPSLPEAVKRADFTMTAPVVKPASQGTHLLALQPSSLDENNELTNF
jgi:hypothetical protein